MRLALEHFHFGAADAFHQHSGLRDVIAADGIGLADQHQSRRLDIAQAMRTFEVMARYAQVNERVEFGVGCPGDLEKTLRLDRGAARGNLW